MLTSPIEIGGQKCHINIIGGKTPSSKSLLSIQFLGYLRGQMSFRNLIVSIVRLESR